jgi:O-antigen/teichoic acid export membrane protein
VYDVTSTVVQCALTIALAYAIPSVWALVWGLMISTMFSTVLSYALGARRLPRLALHREQVREIIHFGKWVFLATVLYFAATSADKAFFGAVLPMAAVGVYSVARTFSDMAAQLAQRLGAFLVFPKVASFQGQHHAAAERLRRTRRHTLALVALGMGFAIAGADGFILMCYDPRYHAAAFMLPVLLFGVWFGVLAIFAEAVLLGCDRPAPGAFANAGKFAILAVGLPLAFALGGLFGGLLVLALAECGRWLLLGRALVREKLGFLGDDLALTALLIGSAGLGKLALGAIGIVPDFTEWWMLGSDLHG